MYTYTMMGTYIFSKEWIFSLHQYVTGLMKDETIRQREHEGVESSGIELHSSR